MKKRLMTGLALLCMLVMVLGMVPYTAYARDLQDVQKEIEQKKNELAALEEKITANQNNKAVAEAALADYQVQYDEMVALINEQENMIAITTDTLDKKTQQMNDTIESIQTNKDLLEHRLRVIYDMNSSNAMISTLLAVENFSDMMQVADAMKRVSGRDTALLEDLSARQQEYETQSLELQELMEALNAEMLVLQENRDWCTAKIEEMQTIIANANYNIQLSEQQSEETEKEIKALQEEYARIFRELQQKGSQYGDNSIRYVGNILWPVEGYWRISSYYGDPRSNTRNHYGIDIPGPEGTPIRAAASGTVITSEWHYSYGYYIVLDHGQGFRTLYAHNTTLLVTVGNFVNVGDTISLMGNTGNSYGSHLHFEVHEHGTRQNPIGPDYLTPVSA